MGHTMLLTRTAIARAYAGHGGLTKGEDYVYVLSVTGNTAGEHLPDITYHYRHHESAEPNDKAYVLGPVDLAEDAHDAPDPAPVSVDPRG
ncbi:hypothetical protein [Streptomyces albipurpureus]|uniref:Uncharacterized protein n=1 Tax=Streptomyces albipurpureus TaxID=2897419 RepID=A0ABT0UJA2_9ACTN|nr:hypothetical protein [Streptomyces sp. CWNU-1]MCM2387371.1 hypothetical protein [Streptomyces sp. CWNU-1]